MVSGKGAARRGVNTRHRRWQSEDMAAHCYSKRSTGSEWERVAGLEHWSEVAARCNLERARLCLSTANATRSFKTRDATKTHTGTSVLFTTSSHCCPCMSHIF